VHNFFSQKRPGKMQVSASGQGIFKLLYLSSDLPSFLRFFLSVPAALTSGLSPSRTFRLSENAGSKTDVHT
jgi:hypothetical protein